MTLKPILHLLQDHGIVHHPRRFTYFAKITGASRKIKAGRYRFEGRYTLHQILKKLTIGEVHRIKVTFPEGIRSWGVASTLQKKLDVDSVDVMTLIHDTTFCREMHIDAPNLEGYLYPNTYFFDYNVTAKEALEFMVSHFWSLFNDTLQARARELNYSVHNVVTLASIVEGEAILDDERPIIAALYQNRLKKRMRLEADPTIQFIIPNGPRRLLNNDLEIDSPYNTYLHYGLPPGPVNNPGVKSIRAVLYPAESPFLFMVANGDGSHTFSKTYSEHIRAKNAFDAYRRQVRRNR